MHIIPETKIWGVESETRLILQSPVKLTVTHKFHINRNLEQPTTIGNLSAKMKYLAGNKIRYTGVISIRKDQNSAYI